MRYIYIACLLALLTTCNMINKSEQNDEDNDTSLITQKSKMSPITNVVECFAGMNVDIPKEAVFYLGEVSVANIEPLANKQWCILANGQVLYAHNQKPWNEGTGLFNTKLSPANYAFIPSDTLVNFIQFINTNGFFELAPIVKTPTNLAVNGGTDAYIWVKQGTRISCVRFEPEVALRKAIKDRFLALLRPIEK